MGGCSATPSASRRAPTFRPGREHPAHGDPLPQGARSPEPEAPGADDRRGSAPRTRPTSCARSATSTTSRTPPRICTRAGVHPAEGDDRARRSNGCAPRTSRQEARIVLRARARRAGADRAPDRGAAQEHPRSAPRDHRAAGGAQRPWPREDDREGAAARGADPVEDQRAAPVQADRGRRDRERPGVFPLDVPGRDPAPLRRNRGRHRAGHAAWRRSCASRAGSAATATATRT